MKEINYCSECDKKLTAEDKEMNRASGFDYEDWICIDCDSESDPT